MPRHPQGHPAEYPIIAVGPPIVPPDGGAARAWGSIAEVAALITDDLIAEGVQCIREAMRATMFVRGNPCGGMRFGYEEVPDYASRLAATRLALAYRFGNPVSASEIRLLRAPTDEPTRLSPEEQLRELRATGIDLENVVRTWLEGLDDVTPGAQKPKKQEENSETGPTAPLADVFLDV